MSKSSKVKNIVVELVYNVDGTIDVESAHASFGDQLETLLTVAAAEEHDYETAVMSVFEKFPGARFNRDAIVYGALRYMNVDTLEVRGVERGLRNWLKSNTDSENENTGRRFIAYRGPHGGLGLRHTEEREESDRDTLLPPTLDPEIEVTEGTVNAAE